MNKESNIVRKLKGRKVSAIVLYSLFASLALQILLQLLSPYRISRIDPLPDTPDTEIIKLLGFSDAIAISRIIMLWLQAFDNQAGVSIPFSKLDFDKVSAWLDIVVRLDPGTQYPVLAASRIYSEVPDETKKRKMLEFVFHKFIEDPDHRWPALVHAVYVANYRLKDLSLALRYADALAGMVTPDKVPFWVRQMNIIVLDKMKEIDSVSNYIGSMKDADVVNGINKPEY